MESTKTLTRRDLVIEFSIDSNNLEKMERASVNELMGLLEKFGEFFREKPGEIYQITEQEINYVAEKLNFKLPPSYVQLWQGINWFFLSHFDLCGVFNPERDYSQEFNSIPDLVFENQSIRNSTHPKVLAPPDFLVIFDVKSAIDNDYTCFDSRYPNETGEYPIVYWDAHNPDIDDPPTTLPLKEELFIMAPDYPTYLYKTLSPLIKRLES